MEGHNNEKRLEGLCASSSPEEEDESLTELAESLPIALKSYIFKVELLNTKV